MIYRILACFCIGAARVHSEANWSDCFEDPEVCYQTASSQEDSGRTANAMRTEGPMTCEPLSTLGLPRDC